MAQIIGILKYYYCYKSNTLSFNAFRYTYTKENTMKINEKRQCKGGGIMVWGMVTPNGILTIKRLHGKIKSQNYLDMLKNFAVVIMKLNMRPHFSFVQDNCTIHKTKEVQNYLQSQNIRLIDWPSRSPDLNIIENMWKVMSDLVYDAGQPKNLKELEQRLFEAANTINNDKRHVINNLYNGFRHRLTSVLRCQGGVFK